VWWWWSWSWSWSSWSSSLSYLERHVPSLLYSLPITVKGTTHIHTLLSPQDIIYLYIFCVYTITFVLSFIYRLRPYLLPRFHFGRPLSLWFILVSFHPISTQLNSSYLNARLSFSFNLPATNLLVTIRGDLPVSPVPAPAPAPSYLLFVNTHPTPSPPARHHVHQSRLHHNGNNSALYPLVRRLCSRGCLVAPIRLSLSRCARARDVCQLRALRRAWVRLGLECFVLYGMVLLGG
jgi:hypothetical protein